jgi:hypothetical protein
VLGGVRGIGTGSIERLGRWVWFGFWFGVVGCCFLLWCIWFLLFGLYHYGFEMKADLLRVSYYKHWGGFLDRQTLQ